MCSQLLHLPYVHRAELYPLPPFHFDATLHKPSHFPSSDNRWQPGTRWQTMLWQGQPLGLKFAAQGTVEQPKILLSIWSQEALEQAFLESLLAEIRYRYNLYLDLGPFNQRFKDDPQLGPVIQRWLGTRPMSYSSLYEYLIIAIVLQNATVRRSVSMHQALMDAFGTRLAYDDLELSCFWPAQRLAAVSEDVLRLLKVGYRAKSILRVTGAFIQGAIDEMKLRSQSLAEQRQALLSLYGVGPASVGYILFDVFHHLDEFDHISPWENRIYSKLFFNVDPDTPVPVKDLMKLFQERYGGYKMLAVSYLWEDLFWKRKTEHIDWLEKLIRL